VFKVSIVPCSAALNDGSWLCVYTGLGRATHASPHQSACLLCSEIHFYTIPCALFTECVHLKVLLKARISSLLCSTQFCVGTVQLQIKLVHLIQSTYHDCSSWFCLMESIRHSPQLLQEGRQQGTSPLGWDGSSTGSGPDAVLQAVLAARPVRGGCLAPAAQSQAGWAARLLKNWHFCFVIGLYAFLLCSWHWGGYRVEGCVMTGVGLVCQWVRTCRYLGRAERRGEHPCSELLLISNYILSPPWPCLPALADSERLVSHCQALLTCLRRRAAGKAVLAAAGDEQFLPSLSFSQLLTSKNGF